jgi:Ni,Fe-hydrogenase maturation factor
VDAASGTGSASSHRLEPADVLALARELWGASAPMFAVTVGVASTGLGEGLSPAVERALPAVVDAVVGVVAEHGPI